MDKLLKIILTTAMIAVAAISITACGGADALNGTWTQTTNVEGAGEFVIDMTFDKGNYSLSINGIQMQSGTYTKDRDRISIVITNASGQRSVATSTVTIDGNTLTITDESGAQIYTRKQ